MDGKIELRLAAAALHELHALPDLLWAFSTVLAANDRFVADTRQGFAPRTCK